MTRKAGFSALLAMAVVLFIAGPSHSRTTLNLGGNPLGIQGFVSQSLQFSLKGDHWDTEQDINAVISNFFVEADYDVNPNWSIYGAAMVTVDWIYQFKDGDASWKRKRFSESKSDLNVDDEWWQILKEFHITWDPGAFFARIGKQRVGWGEMEVFAVNDLINPTDQTRGFSEIELETLFIPIPLLRTDYALVSSLGPVSDVSFQFVFNPNADFIGNQGTFYGNDAAGIWAVDLIDTSLGSPIRIGRQDVDLDEPDAFDSDYFEYGLRLSSVISYNTLFSIMGFYGRANTPVSTFGAGLAADSFTVFDDEGIPIVNFTDTGSYPRQKFVGFALASQLPIQITFLGGVEPVVRFEGSYQFDNRFFDFNRFDFVETDQVVLGMNLDYKVRVPWQRQFFYFFLEAQYNNLMDYGNDWDISTSSIYRKYYWSFYAFVSTGYFRGELEPSLAWYALDNSNVQIITPGLTYYFSDTWQFALKANFFTGPDIGEWGFRNKDNLVFKVQFQY
jgi:hypothetical protein